MITEEQLEKQRNLVRKAWGLKEPRYGYLPKWFRTKMKKQIIPYDILDHWGTDKTEDGYIAIFEPYATTCGTDEADKIAKTIANKIGCRYYVSLKSYWYPGYTIRIAFYEDKGPIEGKVT